MHCNVVNERRWDKGLRNADYSLYAHSMCIVSHSQTRSTVQIEIFKYQPENGFSIRWTSTFRLLALLLVCLLCCSVFFARAIRCFMLFLCNWFAHSLYCSLSHEYTFFILLRVLLPHICRFLSSFVICVHCILCMFSTSFATLLAPLLNEMQSCCMYVLLSLLLLLLCMDSKMRQNSIFVIDKWIAQIRFETFWFLFINLTTAFICSAVARLPACLLACPRWNGRSGFISVCIVGFFFFLEFDKLAYSFYEATNWTANIPKIKIIGRIEKFFMLGPMEWGCVSHRFH